jgi:hypothetical protein
LIQPKILGKFHMILPPATKVLQPVRVGKLSKRRCEKPSPDGANISAKTTHGLCRANHQNLSSPPAKNILISRIPKSGL